MYNSAFYKMAARTRLKGNYAAAFIGTLIYIIPTYLLTLITTLSYGSVIGMIIMPVFMLLVNNIFDVGYMRFLLSIEPKDENQSESRHDYNYILSGYTERFGHTLKTTFIRDIKLLGWELLPLVPIVVFLGVSALIIACSEQGSALLSQVMQLILSPSYEMIIYTSEFIAEHFTWLVILLFIAFMGMIALFIPCIYKSYEYRVVEMVVADKRNMDTSEVFKRTHDIMHGFRKRLFFIQLSFWAFNLFALMLQQAGSLLIYYLALCFIMPYMKVTELEFYRERTYMIEYNASKNKSNQ